MGGPDAARGDRRVGTTLVLVHVSSCVAMYLHIYLSWSSTTCRSHRKAYNPEQCEMQCRRFYEYERCISRVVRSVLADHMRLCDSASSLHSLHILGGPGPGGASSAGSMENKTPTGGGHASRAHLGSIGEDSTSERGPGLVPDVPLEILDWLVQASEAAPKNYAALIHSTADRVDDFLVRESIGFCLLRRLLARELSREKNSTVSEVLDCVRQVWGMQHKKTSTAAAAALAYDQRRRMVAMLLRVASGESLSAGVGGRGDDVHQQTAALCILASSWDPDLEADLFKEVSRNLLSFEKRAPPEAVQNKFSARAREVCFQLFGTAEQSPEFLPEFLEDGLRSLKKIREESDFLPGNTTVANPLYSSSVAMDVLGLFNLEKRLPVVPSDAGSLETGTSGSPFEETILGPKICGLGVMLPPEDAAPRVSLTSGDISNVLAPFPTLVPAFGLGGELARPPSLVGNNSGKTLSEQTSRTEHDRLLHFLRSLDLFARLHNKDFHDVLATKPKLGEFFFTLLFEAVPVQKHSNLLGCRLLTIRLLGRIHPKHLRTVVCENSALKERDLVSNLFQYYVMGKNGPLRFEVVKLVRQWLLLGGAFVAPASSLGSSESDSEGRLATSGRVMVDRDRRSSLFKLPFLCGASMFFSRKCRNS